MQIAPDAAIDLNPALHGYLEKSRFHLISASQENESSLSNKSIFSYEAIADGFRNFSSRPRGAINPSLQSPSAKVRNGTFLDHLVLKLTKLVTGL